MISKNAKLGWLCALLMSLPFSSIAKITGTFAGLPVQGELDRPVFKGELELHQHVMSQARLAWRLEHVEQLEKDCQRYQSEGERTPSGLWKLTLFQQAIDSEIRSSLEHVEKGQEEDFIYQKLAAWDKAYPDSSCALITRARAYTGVGWIYRGGGYIHTVSPENREIFKSWVNRAVEELETNKVKGSHNPDWYVTRMNLAKLRGELGEGFLVLMQEAMARHPSYYEIYFSMMHAAVPKWGGSVEAMEELARFVLDRTKQEEGFSMYVRMYWVVMDQYGMDRFFLDTQANWPLMKQGFYDLIQRYPGEWNETAFAKFSCMAGDVELTKKLLQKLDDRVVVDMFEEDWLLDNCRNLGKMWENK